MAGTVVIIVVLALFPVVFLMTNVIAAGVVGFFLQEDRDDAYEGTEYYALAHGPAAPAEE